MKKILGSVGVLAVVGALVLGATGAFFSDTETSTGNTFTAGAIDLKVDSEQHYNNAVCEGGVWVVANPTVPQYPVAGSACGGTWGQEGDGEDITNQKFFDFADIKPGDEGENTISLHVINNDAWLCAEVSGLTSNDVSLTEPEDLVDPDDMVSGELDDQMIWTIWRDNGDNIMNGNEVALLSGHPVNGVLPLYDSTTGPALQGNSTTYLGVKWELPPTSGNETQTDSLTADISFRVEQARNNTGFRCDRQQEPPVVSDRIDVGDSTSMTAHNAQMWFNDPATGNYGGRDGGQTIAMVGGDDNASQSCDSNENDATFVMNAGSGTAENLIIRHLDGSANDSFNVYVDNVLVGNYIGTPGPETWVTTTFPLGTEDFTGLATIKLEVTTGYPWSLCSTYGQVAVNWAKIN